VVTLFPPDRSGISEFAWALVGELERLPSVHHLLVLANCSPSEESARDRPGTASVEIEHAWEYGRGAGVFALVSRLASWRPDLTLINGHVASWGPDRVTNAMFAFLPMLLECRGLTAYYIRHFRWADIPRDWRRRYGAGIVTNAMVRATEMLISRGSSRVIQVVDVSGARQAETLPLINPYDPPSAQAREQIVATFGVWGVHRRLETLIAGWQISELWREGWTLSVLGAEHPKAPGYLSQVIARCDDNWNVKIVGECSRTRLIDGIYAASALVLPFQFFSGPSLSYTIARAVDVPVFVEDPLMALPLAENVRRFSSVEELARQLRVSISPSAPPTTRT
jgi:hypothetical protein